MPDRCTQQKDMAASNEALLHVAGEDCHLACWKLGSSKSGTQVGQSFTQGPSEALLLSQLASCSFLHQGSWGWHTHTLGTWLGLALLSTDLTLMSVENFLNTKLTLPLCIR